MAGEIHQTLGIKTSTSMESPYAELPFQISDTEDSDEAEILIATIVTPTYTLTDGRVIFLKEWTKDHIGGGVWNVMVRFASTEPKQPGLQSFNFDTSGGTTNIKQSIETVGTYPRPGITAPNNKGAINDNGNGVEGVDINVAHFSFSITRYVRVMELPGTYFNDLLGITGKVNVATFVVTLMGSQTLTFAPGECLFLGATGSQKGLEDFEITFKFSRSENKVGITMGDIEDIEKRGWEYLWVKYEKVDSNHRITHNPLAVYVEQVYEYGDFSLLGIS